MQRQVILRLASHLMEFEDGVSQNILSISNESHAAPGDSPPCFLPPSMFLQIDANMIQQINIHEISA
jgi:hypothetical protein